VDYQGNGLGKYMMKQILSQIDQLNLPAYLGTQKPSNLHFYSKCGFSIVKHIQLEDGPSFWLMKRPAIRPSQVDDSNQTGDYQISSDGIEKNRTSSWYKIVALMSLVTFVAGTYLQS
jgi:hypothetical protein